MSKVVIGMIPDLHAARVEAAEVRMPEERASGGTSQGIRTIQAFRVWGVD